MDYLNPLGFNHECKALILPECGQLFPFGLFFKPVHLGDDGVVAGLNPSMPAVDGGVGLMRQISVVVFLRILKEQFHLFMEIARS